MSQTYSWNAEFLDKMSVMNRTKGVHCQKSFPVIQTSSLHQVAPVCRGLPLNVDLELLLVDWERKKIVHCNSSIS